ALEHPHLEPGRGQVGRAGQAVVAAADDQCLVVNVPAVHSRKHRTKPRGPEACRPPRRLLASIVMPENDDITRLLNLARDGEPGQLGAVFEALYPELRRLANSRMLGSESTFTPTVLVHELFLRINRGTPLSVTDRNHFFAASAKAMRWILVEHARRRATDKRGGDQVMVDLDDRIPDNAAVAMTTALALDKIGRAHV